MVTRRPRRNPGKSLWEIGEDTAAARMRLGASAANVRRFVDRAAQGKGAEETEE